jgi:hypothetical protein
MKKTGKQNLKPNQALGSRLAASCGRVAKFGSLTRLHTQMESKPANESRRSRRVAFWIVFLTFVVLCLLYLYPGMVRRGNARRTQQIIELMLLADARFRAVTISCSTYGSCALHGTVQSSADLEALRAMVERAQSPSQPFFNVTITKSP